MARDPALRVTGVDRDPAVLALARRGAEANRLSSALTRTQAMSRRPPASPLAPVDQVVANPPYRPRGDQSPARVGAPAMRKLVPPLPTGLTRPAVCWFTKGA